MSRLTSWLRCRRVAVVTLTPLCPLTLLAYPAVVLRLWLCAGCHPRHASSHSIGVDRRLLDASKIEINRAATPRQWPVNQLTFVWTPPLDPTVGPRVAIASLRLCFSSR